MAFEQHKEIAIGSNNFSARVFDGGYANMEDPTSAMAQLFLIQQKAPGDYSRKINGAEQNYQDNLIVAKRKKCDTANYPISLFMNLKSVQMNPLRKEKRQDGLSKTASSLSQ